MTEQDAGDLAENIVMLANDPALRVRMGEANRQKYANFYTVEHYGRRMASVFEELVARRKRANHSP